MFKQYAAYFTALIYKLKRREKKNVVNNKDSLGAQ